MYTKFSNKTKKLKQHHHVNLDREFRFDLEVWRIFLTHYQKKAVCRPMVDLDRFLTSQQLVFYSDASANKSLGFRAIYQTRWIYRQWKPEYISSCKPSIEYLELFALTMAILTWSEEQELQNNRIIIFCDSEAVVQMVNQVTSSCQNCMYLIRLLVPNGLVAN